MTTAQFYSKIKRLCSRASSLLLLFQKSPIVQMLFPQANFLASSSAMTSSGFAIATVVGLGAYDSVAGATQIVQISPNPNSSTVSVTAGANVAVVFQFQGSSDTPGSWSMTGPVQNQLPAGLVLSPDAGKTTTITGSTNEVGSRQIRVTAWQNAEFSGDSVIGLFTLQVTAGTAAAISTQPASKTINSGQTTTLTVTATGTAPLTYQWYQGASGDTSTPVGTNSSSFSTPTLTTTTSYWVNVSNSANPTGANSNTATVTVRQPPAITSQPVSTTINSGETTTLSVGATGDSLTYQWYRGASGDTNNPVGANQASFTTPALTATTSYWVKISNVVVPSGVFSNTATVTVQNPASIVTSPASVTINGGETAMLTVAAAGDAPLHYQWYEGAAGVTTSPVGTDSADFTTPPLSTTTSYWVQVTNAANPTGANSQAAVVTVLFSTPPWVFALDRVDGPVSVSTRGAENSTWFGWINFNDEGQRNQPIDDTTPDFGPSDMGARFQTTNAEDHVLDTGVFSFAGGQLSERITVPTMGTVGPDGFTTLVVQMTAAAGSGPFTEEIQLSSINGVAPIVVQGVNSLGDGQLWAKWELPGNAATYTVDITSASANTNFSFDTVMVDTLFSAADYMPDSVTEISPSIVTASPLPLAVVGSPYSEQIDAGGGTAPYEFVVGSGALPAGLTLSEKGLISGTPTAAGSAQFSVLMADANVLTAQKTFNLTAATRPSITSASPLPTARVGIAYNATLALTDGTAPFIWTVANGVLPDGLTLSSSGTVSGMPTASSSAQFTAHVEDANGLTDEKTFDIVVSDLAIATASLPIAVKKVAYTTSLMASGGTAPYAWDLANGALPAGFSLTNDGTLSGNSAAPGVFPITVRVTDDTGFAVTQALTLTVSGTFVAPVLDPVNFPTITIGTDFAYTVTASNYPKSFIISGLPAGLKAASATGVISGYPIVSGAFNIKIRATNTGGSSPTITARLNVKALDRNLVGAFGGLIARDAGVNASLGGSWSLTSTSNGSFSLKVVSALAKSGASGGGASYTAKGRLGAAAPQVNVAVGGQNLTLTINAADGSVTGALGGAAVNGWKSTYNTLSNPADSLQGYYSFALDLANSLDRHNASIPQGIGFATFNVTSAGNVAIVGKTADGETITSAMFAGPNGEVALYTPIYKKLGTIMGQLSLTEDANGLFSGTTVSGPLTWFKPATKTKSYPDAFGPVDLNAEGAYLAPASKGNVVIGVPDPGAAGIFFADGGLDQSETDPNLTFTYTDDDKVVLPAVAANPAKVSLTINPATGAVSGKFSLVETTTGLKRSNIPFLGQVVRATDGTVKAAGFFMLPQIPEPGKAASTAPSLSGGFTLEQSLP